MVNQICPSCQRIITYMPHIGDFVHECNSGQKALDEEDIKVIGNYEDYTTNGVVKVNPKRILIAGMQNTLRGTKATIENPKARDFSRTERGKNIHIYRTRQKQFYIKTKNEGGS